MKTIEIPCYDIVIELDEPIEKEDGIIGGYGYGFILHSNLKEKCPHCYTDSCSGDCIGAQEYISDRDINEQNRKQEEVKRMCAYNNSMIALESMILAHAVAGIDVTSPAYVEGIETAVETCI